MALVLVVAYSGGVSYATWVTGVPLSGAVGTGSLSIEVDPPRADLHFFCHEHEECSWPQVRLRRLKITNTGSIPVSLGGSVGPLSAELAGICDHIDVIVTKLGSPWVVFHGSLCELEGEDLELFDQLDPGKTRRVILTFGFDCPDDAGEWVFESALDGTITGRQWNGVVGGWLDAAGWGVDFNINVKPSFWMPEPDEDEGEIEIEIDEEVNVDEGVVSTDPEEEATEDEEALDEPAEEPEGEPAEEPEDEDVDGSNDQPSIEDVTPEEDDESEAEQDEEEPGPSETEDGDELEEESSDGPGGQDEAESPSVGEEEPSASNPPEVEEATAEDEEPAPASLNGRVWLDPDLDGIWDTEEAEPGLPGVEVVLLDEGGVVVAASTTDVGGGYIFADLAPGTYRVEVHAPTGHGFEYLLAPEPDVLEKLGADRGVPIEEIVVGDLIEFDEPTDENWWVGRSEYFELAPGENAGFGDAPLVVVSEPLETGPAGEAEPISDEESVVVSQNPNAVATEPEEAELSREEQEEAAP